MEKIRKIWSDFKAQPDVWFFYGFLVTFTLSIRKVLLFYPIDGGFNEYTGIYLYLSDLFLIFTIVFWFLGYLYNKKLNLSIYTHKLSTLINRHNLLITLPLALIVWSFISIGWSGNWQVSLFRSVKFLEFYLLYLYVVYRIVPHGTILKWVLRLLIISGLFQAIIGIWQFIIQKSIGLFWLKESLISPSIGGVAKILIGGEKYIRAYGLFLHPNILGGFLVVTIILSLLCNKMFHVEQNCKEAGKNVPRGTFEYLLPIFVLIQIIALFLSFSKSAWIGLFLALVYIYLKIIAGCSTDIQKGNVPSQYDRKCSTSVILKCSTWNILGITGQAWNKFRVLGRRGTVTVIIVIVIVVLALFMSKLNLSDFLLKSINERTLYLNDSVEIIKHSPTNGIGSGQFVLEMQKYSQTQLEYWQFQPVHNVFLLIWSELGIIGLIIFLWFIRELFRACPERIKCSNQKRSNLFHPEKEQNVPRGTFWSFWARVEQIVSSGQAWNNLAFFGVEQSIIFKGILLGLIFIMLFDHYLWDIQQGQIIFWLLAGILVNMSSSEKTSIES